MATTTLSVKVDPQFAREFRDFCEAHFLQVGKFAEHALREVMEDFYFGTKAQRVLSGEAGKPVRHEAYFAKSPRSRSSRK
jgi:hypothetical protein